MDYNTLTYILHACINRKFNSIYIHIYIFSCIAIDTHTHTYIVYTNLQELVNFTFVMLCLHTVIRTIKQLNANL